MMVCRRRRLKKRQKGAGCRSMTSSALMDWRAVGGIVLETSFPRRIVRSMRMGSAVCSKCRAGFRRLELESEPGSKGEYRCPLCDNLLETFDGNKLIAYRIMIVPPKYLDSQGTLDFARHDRNPGHSAMGLG